MPYYKNAPKLKNLMDQLDHLLHSIFADLKINKSFAEQLKQVTLFYRRAFNKTEKESSGSNIIKEYEDLIAKIQQVKNGTLTVNQAIEEINNCTEDKRIDIVIHNLLTVCELLSWAALAAFLYVNCVTVGLSLMLCEPFLGTVITISTAAFLCNSLTCAIECFEQFKSFERIDKEEVREQNLVSFFNKQPAPKEIQLNNAQFEEDKSSAYNFAPI